MPSTRSPATSRERSPTPDGICPLFDFKELDATGDASEAAEDSGTSPGKTCGAALAGGAAAAAPPAAVAEAAAAERGGGAAAATAGRGQPAEEAAFDLWDPWDLGDRSPKASAKETAPPEAGTDSVSQGEEEEEEEAPAPAKEHGGQAAAEQRGPEAAGGSVQAAEAAAPEPQEQRSGGEDSWAHAAWQMWQATQAQPQQQGEWYVVTIATYVNIYPMPDDKSTPVLGRYGRNETVLVFEWDVGHTWRRCRTQLPEGNPGMYGWVKVLTNKYGPLMVPARQTQQLHKLCSGDASGVLRAVLDDMCEENVQKHVPDMLRDKKTSRQDLLRTARRVRTPGADAPLKVDDGRLVLGPWKRPAAAASKSAAFRRVLVMGAHHTCSTALTRELEAQFCVRVENNYDTVNPDARPENHKHRVMQRPPVPEDALIVCLVKDPFFWLQSLTRHAATYAIRDLHELPDGSYEDSQRRVGSMEERPQEELLDAILGTVEFFGDIYPNGGALRVWEASVRSYFDEAIYPLRRTAVVRCEDFLFSFEAVMEALSELGLERRPSPPPPNGRHAKGGVMHFKARDREEALSWYGEAANRYVGLEPRHVASVATLLGGLVLGPLGYGDDAVLSWSSRPRRLFVAGSWSQYRPLAMAWDGRCYFHSMRLGRNSQESFQLLLDGSWDTVIYPSVADANPVDDHEILGPDDRGHGKNWTIQRSGMARVGNRCNITAEVNDDGMPVRVWWEVVPA